jgi:hypothetical protein
VGWQADLRLRRIASVKSSSDEGAAAFNRWLRQLARPMVREVARRNPRHPSRSSATPRVAARIPSPDLSAMPRAAGIARADY